MSQVPAKPKEMPWISQYITVKNPRDSIAFYEKAFGFKCRMVMEGKNKEVEHAELTYNDGVIMIGPECPQQNSKSASSFGGSPVGLYLYVEKVDEFFKKAVEAGAKPINPPTDMFYGDRNCCLSDPDGLVWSFATHVKDLTPEEMKKAQEAFMAAQAYSLGEPKFLKKEKFHVVGMSGTFDKTNGPTGIPLLWDRFIGRMGEIQNIKSNKVCFGLCECTSTAGFVYSPCVETTELKDIPHGMVGKTVWPQEYAVFTHKGSLAKIQKSFDYIFQEWLPQSNYKEAESAPEFELYDERFNGKDPHSPDSQFDIYIPVVKK